MFMLAISVGEVQPGDVLQNQQGAQLEVKSITEPSPGQPYPGTWLHFTKGGDYFVPVTSKQTFTLVHRRRPGADGDVEAFEKVLDSVYEFDEARWKKVTFITKEHYLERLTKTIASYWLGKEQKPDEMPPG